MIKRLISVFVVIVLLLMLSIPAFATTYTYSIKVYRDNGSFTTTGGSGKLATTGIQYIVLTAGAQTLASIYSNAGLTTALTNPVSSTQFATDDAISFYTNTSTVDIIVTDEVGGFSTFIDGASADTTHVIINERPGIMHHGIIWFNTSCTATYINDCANVTTNASGSFDTGIDFPIGTFIHNVLVEVVSADNQSDNYLGVGLGASYQGLVQAAYTDRPHGPSFSNAFVAYSDQSYGFSGSLLCPTFASNVESGTAEVPISPYLVTTAVSLNWGFESVSDWDDMGEAYDAMGYGFIHYWFVPATSR